MWLLFTAHTIVLAFTAILALTYYAGLLNTMAVIALIAFFTALTFIFLWLFAIIVIRYNITIAT
jgi:hypothetical protein